MDYTKYINWLDILEKSKSWPPDEQLRFYEFKKNLTGIISKTGRWYILKSDWERFKKGKPAVLEI